MNIKTGDRIRDSFLGEGEVLANRKEFAKEVGGDIGLIRVKFDQTPPFEYNCCQNPTVVFEHQVERLA